MRPLWSAFDLLVRVGLGGMLAWAGWEKMRAFGWWRDVVENLGIFPEAWVGPLAGALPGVEIIVGLAFLFGLWTRAATWGTTAMFLGFSITMFVVVARGTDVRCGCFGPNSDYPVSVSHGLTNLALAVLAAMVTLIPGRLRLERIALRS